MIKIIHLDKALRGEAAYLASIEQARRDAKGLREVMGESAKEAVLTPPGGLSPQVGGKGDAP